MKICRLCLINQPISNYHIHSRKKNGDARTDTRCKTCVINIKKKEGEIKDGYIDPSNNGDYKKRCTLHKILSHENTLIRIRKSKQGVYSATAHCLICIRIKYKDDSAFWFSNEYDKNHSINKVYEGSLNCYKCKIRKDIEFFRKCDLNRRYSKCIECSKQYEFLHHKKLMLRKKYNLSLEQYDQMKIDQNSLCKICGNPETKLHNSSGTPIDLSVDHCHKTGKNRCLLCSSCNVGLGYFKDCPIILRAAANYLEQFNETT